MFMNNLGRAQFAAVHRKFFMTEKQRLWADVYRCAYMRWQDSHYSDEGEWKELGDYARERGKLQFAREAYRLSGDRKAMDAVDALIHPKKDAVDARPENDAGSDAIE